MKKVILMLAFGLFACVASAQKIEFEAMEINYGNVVKGTDGTRTFRFKNTGAAPLVISNVQKACGCTTPLWTNTPVMPGETGEIQVKYDTQRVGDFTKYVTVTSNSTENSNVQLKIYGKVQEEAAPTPQKESGLFNQ